MGALLRVPLRLIPKNTVLRVRSGANEGLRWIVGSSIHGCWLVHYETEKQAAVRRLVRPGMKVFDIGANAGFYTLAFSRMVGDAGHVWAFEPFPENVHNLRRHIELNALQNVTVAEVAVAEHSGIAGFAPAASNAMGRLSEQSDYKVPTVSIDGMYSGANACLPDLIKLDVEGRKSRFCKARGKRSRAVARSSCSLPTGASRNDGASEF